MKIYATINTEFYYGISTVWVYFCYFVVVSLLAGMILCLGIEVPFSKWQKILEEKIKKKMTKHTISNIDKESLLSSEVIEGEKSERHLIN